MKRIALFPLLLFVGNLFGQETEPSLFEVSKSSGKIYVDKQEGYFVAFDMGQYLDKAGVGSSIRMTDTIRLQADKSYKGSNFKIELKEDQLYIWGITTKKYKLEKVIDIQNAKYHLNNAYYLDSYFAMSDRLNQEFELNHHSFRNGFYTWDKLRNKEIDHLEFRKFTDRIIQQAEDSIASKQQYYTTLTNYIINQIEKLHYAEFKDSISKLPAEFAYQSSYYKTVVNKISKSKPEYIVSLYNDYPGNRTLIEFAVEKDKSLLKKLKVERSKEAATSKKK